MNDFERDNLRSIMGHIQSRGELERLRKTIEECRHAISTSGGDSNVELEKLPDEIRGIWLRCDDLIKSLHPDGLVVDELERRTTYTVGETELAHRIATLEHMLSEERENVDTLRAAVEHAEQRFVDEYDARRDVERQRDELQARITTLEAMKP